MKNVLGKVLVMAAVSFMTLGIYSETEYDTIDSSYETSVDNPLDEECYDTNIITDTGEDDCHEM